MDVWVKRPFNLHSRQEIILLKETFGHEGFLIFDVILETLGNTFEQKIPFSGFNYKKFVSAVTIDAFSTEIKVKEIIDFMVEYKLLISDSGFIHNPEITEAVKHYNDIKTKRSEAGSKGGIAKQQKGKPKHPGQLQDESFENTKFDNWDAKTELPKSNGNGNGHKPEHQADVGGIETGMDFNINDGEGKYYRTLENGDRFFFTCDKRAEPNYISFKWPGKNKLDVDKTDAYSFFRNARESDDEKHAAKLERIHVATKLIKSSGCSPDIRSHLGMEKQALINIYRMCEHGLQLQMYDDQLVPYIDFIKKKSKPENRPHLLHDKLIDIITVADEERSTAVTKEIKSKFIRIH